MTETKQIATGFLMMGLGLLSFLLVDSMNLAYVFIGLLALGMALIYPTLYSLTSRLDSSRRGRLLGLQNSSASLGQVLGPSVGGFLFAWQAHSPFVFAAVLLLLTAAMTFEGSLTPVRRDKAK